MAKSIINFQLEDGILTRPVIKALRHGTAVTFITGGDYDDHDIWTMYSGSAQLVGTLTQNAFAGLKNFKTKNPGHLSLEDFGWINGGKAPEISGEIVTVPMLKLDSNAVIQARI